MATGFADARAPRGSLAAVTGLTVLALTVAAVFFKGVALVCVQVVGRLRTKKLAYEEDCKLLPGSTAGDSEGVVRAQHLIRNSLENEPIFLILLTAYIGFHPEGDGALIYAGTFLAARVVHAICFLLRLQPIRTLAYSLGLLAAAGLATQLVLDAL